MAMSLSKCQETVMDREAWHPAVHGGHRDSETAERLNDSVFRISFPFSCCLGLPTSQQAALQSAVLTRGSHRGPPLSRSPSLIDGVSRDWPGGQADGGPAATPHPRVHARRLCPWSELRSGWAEGPAASRRGTSRQRGTTSVSCHTWGAPRCWPRPEAVSGGLPVPARHRGRGLQLPASIGA